VILTIYFTAIPLILRIHMPHLPVCLFQCMISYDMKYCCALQNLRKNQLNLLHCFRNSKIWEKRN